MTAGNRDAEKKTPDKIHMGNMTRFINPDAASMVRAREEMSRPKAEKAIDVSTHRNANCSSEPRNGTPKTRPAKPRNASTSITSMTSRDNKNADKYCQRGMGEATMRLSNFFCRASTMAKPSPQMAEPIRFIPSSPGTTKSM